MQALLRKISRIVLLVLLATVFSPSFGWEAAESMAAHEHASPAAHQAHGDDHHAAPAADCDGCPQHEADGCATTQHHCCPGHQLGHLPGGIVDALRLPMPAQTADLSGNIVSRFTSRVPEGLERPPRVSAV